MCQKGIRAKFVSGPLSQTLEATGGPVGPMDAFC